MSNFIVHDMVFACFFGPHRGKRCRKSERSPSGRIRLAYCFLSSLSGRYLADHTRELGMAAKKGGEGGRGARTIGAQGDFAKGSVESTHKVPTREILRKGQLNRHTRYLEILRKGQLNRHTRYRPATTTRNTATQRSRRSVD